MHIQRSAVQLSSLQQQATLASRVRSASVTETTNGNNTRGAELQLSRETREQQALQSSSQVSLGDEQTRYHSQQFLAQQLTESVTNLKVDISKLHSQVQEDRNGVRVEIRQITEVESAQQLSFEALGQVETSDGRRIDFMLALDLSRYQKEEQSALFRGNVKLVDPLMINLDGEPIALSDQTFDFDLNSDGDTEAIAQTARGTGYLAFDRNGNGKIDDGSELFGPQTGQGFAELAAYDEDGNGWIDSNDSLFPQLSLLMFEKGEPMLMSAADAGLGALYLGSASANYSLLGSAGEVQGSIRNSGVALSENGNVLLLQEVHLKVENQPDAGSDKLQTNLWPINSTPVLSIAANAEVGQMIGSRISSLNLQQWVAESMNGFNLADHRGPDLPQQYWASVPDTMQRPDEPLTLNTSPQDTDGQLQMLRATIETLRAMRQQASAGPLHQYQHIGRFGPR
ncbi:hypothetical protein GJQ54_13455 [Oceanospirillaceae bacterium ASx5O]|nr:hypothetical protein GJQ54_13455 [Oceanospirillaceae bacterium ASx5O]